MIVLLRTVATDICDGDCDKEKHFCFQSAFVVSGDRRRKRTNHCFRNECTSCSS